MKELNEAGEQAYWKWYDDELFKAVTGDDL